MSKIIDFLKDERGLETIEYAIVLGVLTATLIASITALGTWVSAQYQTMVDTVNPPTTP